MKKRINHTDKPMDNIKGIPDFLPSSIELKHKIAIDNPDLPDLFIDQCLDALDETRNGHIENYKFG